MSTEEVTLVNKGANPPTYTTSNPRTITQLKSQGYRVVDAAEAPETGYMAQSVAELRTEVARRNEARSEDEQIVVDGRTKAAYADALTADDDAQAGEDA